MSPDPLFLPTSQIPPCLPVLPSWFLAASISLTPIPTHLSPLVPRQELPLPDLGALPCSGLTHHLYTPLVGDEPLTVQPWYPNQGLQRGHVVVVSRLDPHLVQRTRDCRALNATPIATPDPTLLGWSPRTPSSLGSGPWSITPLEPGFRVLLCFLHVANPCPSCKILLRHP